LASVDFVIFGNQSGKGGGEVKNNK